MPVELINENDPIGNGWGYPIRISNGGFMFSGAPKNAVTNDSHRRNVIRQSLGQIIATALGSWTMRRRFGSKLNEVPFNTIIDAGEILKHFVLDAIVKTEKRITNVRCNTTMIPDEGKIEFGISYTIISIGSRDSMTYPWYLHNSGV